MTYTDVRMIGWAPTPRTSNGKELVWHCVVSVNERDAQPVIRVHCDPDTQAKWGKTKLKAGGRRCPRCAEYARRRGW